MVSVIVFVVRVISIREMTGVFFGRKPMEEFASNRYPITDGVVNYSIAFVFTSVLLALEFLVFLFVLGFMAKQGTMKIVAEVGLYGIGLAFLAVVGLLGGIVCTYFWGAVHFFLAKFYAGMPGSLNDFNGSWLSLMGAVTLVQRLLVVIPVLAWFAAEAMEIGNALKFVFVLIGMAPAFIVHLYGVILAYKFIKSRLSIPPARAAIVVLVPIVVLMALLFIPAVIAMVLLGTKVV